MVSTKTGISCLHSRDGLLPLSASEKSSHLLFPLSEEGKPCTGDQVPGTRACGALQRAARQPACITACEWSSLRQQTQCCSPGTQHPPAGGRTSHQGQPGTVPQVPVVMTKLSTPLLFLVSPCPHFPLLHVVFDDAVPHPGCDLVSQCHVPM